MAVRGSRNWPEVEGEGIDVHNVELRVTIEFRSQQEHDNPPSKAVRQVSQLYILAGKIEQDAKVKHPRCALCVKFQLSWVHPKRRTWIWGAPHLSCVFLVRLFYLSMMQVIAAMKDLIGILKGNGIAICKGKIFESILIQEKSSLWAKASVKCVSPAHTCAVRVSLKSVQCGWHSSLFNVMSTFLNVWPSPWYIFLPFIAKLFF